MSYPPSNNDRNRLSDHVRQMGCGVGGSLLSIGSAAGVALLGTSKGQYTFVSHLKWKRVIALG